MDIYHSRLLHPHKCSNPLRSSTLEQVHLVFVEGTLEAHSPELGR
jgi:hypothetical protein